MAVGSRMETTVHLMLLVSLYIVIQVVEQGKWKSVNISIFIAVSRLHPFSASRFFSADKSEISVRFPLAVYDIMIIGTTISFAGIPSIKANIITPSRPSILPKGSKKSVHIERILHSPMLILASSHIRSPAGADTATALPSITRVLSIKERTSVLPIFTFL